MTQVGKTADLATLASDTGVLLAGPVMVAPGKVLSVRGSISIDQVTAGDGPWLVLLAGADLSLAEIEEYLENTGPTHPTDTVKVERASRGKLIRMLGVLVPSGDGSVAAMYLKDVSLAGLPFSEESAGWNYGIYNRGKTMTAGAIMEIATSVFLEWSHP